MGSVREETPEDVQSQVPFISLGLCQYITGVTISRCLVVKPLGVRLSRGEKLPECNRRKAESGFETHSEAGREWREPTSQPAWWLLASSRPVQEQSQFEKAGTLTSRAKGRPKRGWRAHECDQSYVRE